MSSKKPMMESSETSSAPSGHLAHMGQDVIVSILLFLPPEAILCCSMVCRRFRVIASADSLWESICRRDWGGCSVDALLDDRRGEIPSWKKLYQEVSQLGSLYCRQLSSGDGGELPRPRASHSLSFVSDCLVVFGGGYQGGRHLDDTWVAYVGKGFSSVLSWYQVSSGIPSGRFGHSCTVVGDVLVVFGGISDNGVRQSDTWVGEVIHEGPSKIKISWRLLDVGHVTPPPRGAHAACHIGDRRMMIHGGIGVEGHRLNDTWMLDLSDGSWQHISNRQSPPARSGHSLTWIGPNCIVLFAGRGSGLEVLNDVWLLDMEGKDPRWREIKYDSSSNAPCEMPLPRSGHSATLILGGRVLIYGGEDSERRRKDDFWVLDVSGPKKMSRQIWKKLRIEGQCPGYRSFHGACTEVSRSCIFVFGGMADHGGATAHGLRFDGELYLVELHLHL